MKKIVCAHLYNDFSGSPLVLSTIIKGFLKKGMEVNLMSSSASKGCLSNLTVPRIDNAYVFKKNKFLRLILFALCQLRMFVQAFRYRNEEVVFYVNTLLPFGVAIAGKLMNKKVIYHIHETSIRPIYLKRFLKLVVKYTADEIIYVSEFLQKEEGIEGVPSSVIYNALSNEFVAKASLFRQQKKDQGDFTVLMLCSLKKYKGVDEFIALASDLPSLKFELVLNATEAEIAEFFKDRNLSKNLILYPKQNNVHRFYQRAKVILNLSDTQAWVETFGMTLLEGMEYGIPAVAPPVGGPTEIVIPAMNGYQIDARNLKLIAERLLNLSKDLNLYQQFSKNARRTAQLFKVETMEAAAVALVA